MRLLVGTACVVSLLGTAGAFGGGVAAQGRAGQAGPGQGPGRGGGQPTPMAKGTGLVLGQVIDGSSGQPVAGASVLLVPQNAGQAPGRGGPRGGGLATDVIGGVQGAASQTGLNIPNPQFAAGGGNRVITDAQGHFVFYELPAGAFNISVTAAGYVSGQLGQTRPNGPSRPLELADGQRTNETRVRLWKYAIVSGNVQDEVGQPAVGVSVRALRKTTANGRTQLVPAAGGAAMTDDRGDFRIPTLVPGDYLIAIPETQVTMPVAAVQSMTDTLTSGRGGDGLFEFVSSGGPTPSPDGMRIGDNLLQAPGQGHIPAPLVDGGLGAYLSLYFPAALAPSQAGVLTLRSGEEKTGVNMQLRLAGTSTVTGVVVGPDGPMVNAPVKLTPVGVDEAGIDSGFETATTLTRADGSFTLLAVPAGQYVARANKNPRPTLPTGRGGGAAGAEAMASMFLGGASASASVTSPVYAQTTVTVQAGSGAKVDLQLHEGARVSGRIEFVGAAQQPQPRQLQSINLTLAPIDARAFPQPPPPGPPAPGAEPGQFRSSGYPPGRYYAAVTGPVPPGWTVRSVVVNGRDILTSPLELATSDVDGVVVTYTDKVGQIAGMVHGVPQGGSATVLVFPFDFKTWIATGMSPRRLKQSAASPTGAYAAGSLFGDDYYVAALDDADLTDNVDPATFEALARVATHVTLADGEKKTLDLSIVRIR